MSTVKDLMLELKALVLKHVRNTHLKLGKTDDNAMNLLREVRDLLVVGGLDVHTADMIKVVIGKNGLGYEVWFSAGMHSVINHNPELKPLFADPLIHPESHQHGNFVSFMIDLGGEHISRISEDLFHVNGVHRHVHVKPEFIYRDYNGKEVINPTEDQKHYLAKEVVSKTTSAQGTVGITGKARITENDLQRKERSVVSGVKKFTCDNKPN